MVRVDPGHSATLHLPDGLLVSVPVGAVTQPGALSATVTSAPAWAPSGLEITGQVYDLHMSGTALRMMCGWPYPSHCPARMGNRLGPTPRCLSTTTIPQAAGSP